MKNSYIIAVTLLLFAFFPKQSYAVVNSDFGACANPQGTVIADYASGTHGIVGNSGVFTGSDKVYALSSGNAMQCFCASDGNGIQTNWIKNTGFTQSEVAILKNQGWISIPDGSLWGLSQGEYFAKNSSFSCVGNSSSNGGSSNSSSSNNNSNSASSAVLGASATALSTLANTGNSLLFYITLLLGISLTAFGLFAPKKKVKKQSSK